MKELFRTFPLMCVVLLVPVLPFLLFGESFQGWLEDVRNDPPPPIATAGLVVGLLSTDIFLPIPSSVVMTLAGGQLGKWLGTLAAWLGLSLGAAAGFAMARKWGQRFATWFTKEEDLKRMESLNDRFGPLILMLTRAMPVFAEASVLIAGIHRLAWRRFLPAVLLSNLGIAIAYSVFGEYAAQRNSMPLALGISIVLPVLIAGVAQRFLPRLEEAAEESADGD